MIMNMDTLQIKRVTGNWGKYQGNVIAHGEPILINADVIEGVDYPIFLLGDGESSLDDLVKANKMFVDMSVIGALIETNNTNNASTDTPTDITNSNGASGESTKFARADHTHKLDKNIVNTILDITDDSEVYSYRKIKSGTADPTKTTVAGNKGDIYIKYE